MPESLEKALEEGQAALGAHAVPADNDNGGAVHAKRSRVLLNCAPCRVSKLKCDRCSPCGNCLKKDRTDLCTYVPRPKKPEKQAKNMATRLRRLEGMLREMIADDGRLAMSSFGEALNPGAGGQGDSRGSRADLERSPSGEGDKAREEDLEDKSRADAGRVVKGERSTTYVGATHFMAMLDDIEDLKSYFEESPDELSEMLADETAEESSPDSMMLGLGRGWSKEDLLAVMPPRSVVDSLIVRYFGSNTPSSHTVHRPTFAKQYSAFWQDPSGAAVDWLGVLYGMLALGVHYASLAGAAEMGGGGGGADSRRSLAEQFRLYRRATAAALAARRLANPSVRTIQALLMLEEAEFLVNCASQTTCWLLSAVCIRLMLHMGMHRDPSRLPNIAAFDGEMRRRMWNLAIQLDLIVSFHMGLPSMIHGIPSDTSLPHNLLDEDFGPDDAAALPPARPDSEYTPMSYPIFKSVVCRVFGQVARLSHTLAPPSYAEVMRTDALLLDKWQQIPDFMKVRPLADSLFDPPLQIVQRFGLASLFQKSRCVLHRPYLAGAAGAAARRRPEHAYSRRTCLQAALALLGYHEAIYEATQPGGILHKMGWFVTGLGMHDYLLAAMIVYLVVQNKALFADELIVDDRTGTTGSTGSTGSTGNTSGSEWTSTGASSTASPTASAPALPVARSTLVDLLVRSYRLWASVATNHHEVKKAADLLELMMSKIQTGPGQDVVGAGKDYDSSKIESVLPAQSAEVPSLSDISLNETVTTTGNFLDMPFYTQLDLSTPMLPTADMPTMPATTMAPGVYDSWIPMSLEALDWDLVDNGLRANSSHPTDWIDPSTTDDINYLATGPWNQSDVML